MKHKLTGSNSLYSVICRKISREERPLHQKDKAALVSSPSNPHVLLASHIVLSSNNLRKNASPPHMTTVIPQPTHTSASNKASQKKSNYLPKEVLDSLEVVRIHRRPNFKCEDSRELVEVRPQCLPSLPTLLAYRDCQKQILIDWTVASNHKAARFIVDKLTQV